MKKKISKSTVLLINVVVSLIGIITILSGLAVDENAKLKSLLEAVGIGLIATGGVNFLDKTFTNEIYEDAAKPGFIRIVSNARHTGTSDVHLKKYDASKIDIVGINLGRCLEEITEDSQKKIIKHIFSGRLERFRLMLLHPDSGFIKQRALEDNVNEADLKRRQKESVKLCIKFYKLLKEYKISKGINKNQKSALIEIRLIDLSPHIAMERYDNEIYWGLYTSDAVGFRSPVFQVKQIDNDVLFEQLKKHFNGLINKRLDQTFDNVLVKMIINELTLNMDLINKIFSEQQQQEKIKDFLRGNGSIDDI